MSTYIKGSFKDKSGNILTPFTQASQVYIKDSNSADSNLETEIASIRSSISTLSGVDALAFKGVVNGTSGLPASGYKLGDTYKVGAAGTYAGNVCEVGDMLICVATAAANTDWVVIQANIDGAVTGPASAVDANLAAFDGTTGKIVKDSALSITDVSDAVDKKHEHDNQSILDAITATAANINAAATYVSNLTVEASAVNAALTATTGTLAVAEADIDALEAAVGTNDNGGALFTRMAAAETDLAAQTEGPASAVDGDIVAFDGTTGKKVKDSAIAMSDVSDAVSKKHAHTNTVAEIDAATDFIQSLDATVTAAALKTAVADDHTHSNKSVLDAIDSTVKGGYDTASTYVAALTSTAAAVDAAVANIDFCIVAKNGTVPTGLNDNGLYFQKD